MNRQELLRILNQQVPVIQEKFDAKGLAIFGSFARDDAGEGSDLDILVEFRDKATFNGYMGLKFYLEDLLNMSVDLVVEDALRPAFRPYVERDVIEVA